MNDRYGHAVGDRLLVALAERLRRSCGPEDVVARLGGDEFVVVSPAAGDEALTVHERRLAALIEQPFELDGVVVAIGGSVGCAVGAPGEEPDHVVARADLEMYGVKGVRRRARHRAPAEH